MTNSRLDVLYANELAEALFSDIFRDPVRPANLAFDPQRRVPGPLGRARRRVPPGGHQAAAHPLVGDLTLAFEMLELPADPGLSVLTYSAEPGSQSGEAMRDLARWSETRTKLSATRARSEA